MWISPLQSLYLHKTEEHRGWLHSVRYILRVASGITLKYTFIMVCPALRIYRVIQKEVYAFKNVSYKNYWR
jgi:thiaminase